MAEEAAPVPVPAEAEKLEESAAPSTSATPVECDVDNEAKKLMGAGRRHMVMKDIRCAVNAFQEASSILGKKYGETADQCADAFFSYGMALLELSRIESGVLGNALEGMPEDEENGENEEDPNIPSAADLHEKEREQLREQVYDAMAEKEEKAEQAETEGKKENGDVAMEEGDKPSEEKEADKPSEDKESGEAKDKESSDAKNNGEAPAAVLENGDKADKKEAAEEDKKEGAVTEEKTAEESKAEDKSAEEPKKDESTSEVSKADEKSTEEKSEADEKTEVPAKETASEEQPAEGDVAKPEDEPMEGEEEGDAESEDGENEETEDNEGTEEKDNDEDEVGNLQIAWEMLELAKIIFKRQDNKEAQLKAAQACLKLGEVSVESENYDQAIEDFLACLNIQKAHLDAHDRLLAETNYQLGLAYQYSSKHEDAISHFTQSIDVIEKRMAMLTEQVEKAAGESNEELQKEMEELKGLLPDIKEKIEDSKEAQKPDDATEKALKETLVGGSSAFSQENGSTSTTAAPAEKSGDSTVPVTNCVSDISHLVRKKRKPEEESPQKDAKKSKAETVENGSGNGDAVVPTNQEAEKAEEAEKQTAMETTAVETTA